MIKGVIVFGAPAPCDRGRGKRVAACDARTRSEHSRSPSACVATVVLGLQNRLVFVTGLSWPIHVS